MHYDQRPSQIVNAASLPPDLDPPGSLAGPGHRADAISLAFNAGVRIRLASRWLVRPQFAIRLANTGEFGPKYMIRAGVAGGVSW